MQVLENWKEACQSGALDETLRSCSGLPQTETLDVQLRDRGVKLLDGFEAAFASSKQQALACFSVPGRTELLGNHTDHQLGEVIAGSVNLDVWAAGAPNGTGEICFQSAGWPLVTVPLNELEPDPEEFGTTRSLVRGVAAGLVERGAKPTGFDLYCESAVLPGSGLSSSAAIEVLLALAASHFWGRSDLGPVDWAQIGQRAENLFFGKPSGLMDQVACAVGAAVHIDFSQEEAPRVEALPLDLDAAGYALCILDSGADHANLTDAYAAIPTEMRSVAEALGAQRLGAIAPEIFEAKRGAIRGQVSDRAWLRAFHFYQENKRVRQAAETLRNRDVEGFLAQVRESGHSSWNYLQNIYVEGAVAEQAMAVALAVCDEALAGRGACRVHGGGFAGTVQAFVPKSDLAAFVASVESVLGQGACRVLTIREKGAFVWPEPV